MDLQIPLATISPGLDSAALTVLAGTEAALSATQIQRIAGRGSRYGLVLVLERLVDHGVVTAIPAARGNLYQMNRAHVLAPVVEAAVQARAEAETRLVNAAGDLTPRPLSAAIYGSVARGEASADSDIDLLIISSDNLDPEDVTWVGQIDSLERQTRQWTGNLLQAMTVTQAQLAIMAHANAPIVDEWEHDARTIMGKDVRTLIRAARLP
ncbi:MAG: nucleotidyltransferase domain-containing protein [Propionibacteriaceae bacterium]|nr:nucleotidyltransferase domain-containing protein [Propionibacteriaceae bacterium]